VFSMISKTRLFSYSDLCQPPPSKKKNYCLNETQRERERERTNFESFTYIVYIILEILKVTAATQKLAVSHGLHA
jgi:hypothetical protein